MEPKAGARTDIEILTDLMNAMGYPQKLMTPSGVMEEIASVTPSYAGISFARLDAGEGFIEIHFSDAQRLGIENGETVRVSSRRGSITARAHIGRKGSEGEVWMPFHFPDAPVNQLTNAALDEFASIPEYKVCAVKVEKC